MWPCEEDFQHQAILAELPINIDLSPEVQVFVCERAWRLAHVGDLLDVRCFRQWEQRLTFVPLRVLRVCISFGYRACMQNLQYADLMGGGSVFIVVPKLTPHRRDQA